MTGPAGSRPRVLPLAVVTCAAALAIGWLAGAPPAGAAAFCQIVSGDVQANNPAHVGDPVRADARVSGSCSGHTITFEGGGRVIGSGAMSTYKSYYTEFSAFAGLSTVSASVSDGNSMVLGTVNVAGSTATPTPPPTTPVVSTTPVAPPTSRAASTSATKSATTTASTSASRSLTPHTAAFPAAVGDLSSSDTGPPQPSASASSPTSSGVALPVQVIHGSGGVNVIPSGLLIATIVVLGGIAGAAVHFVRAYSQSPDHLT